MNIEMFMLVSTREVFSQYPAPLNHLEEEEKAGCYTFIVLQIYCYYKYFVALPHGAVGWSAVCDCSIS